MSLIAQNNLPMLQPLYRPRRDLVFYILPSHSDTNEFQYCVRIIRTCVH